MAETSYRGTCLCGRVRFHYRPPSLWCGHCHCTMCQRAHGAPIVTWVGVPEGQFVLDAGDDLRWYHSSEEAERGFCRECGSTLFFRSTRWPGEMHIVRSNLEGEIDREPSGHAYWESRVSWLQPADDLPRGGE